MKNKQIKLISFMQFLRLSLLSFGLCIALFQDAFASTLISSSSEEMDISKDFYFDKSELNKNNMSSLRFGYFASEETVNITLVNNENAPIEKLIYFDTLTGFITLSKMSENGEMEPIASGGSSVPYLKRNFASIFTSFPIVIPPNSTNKFFLR